MANSEFRVQEILDILKGSSIIGDKNAEFNKVLRLDVHNTDVKALFWCNKKNEALIKEIQAGVIIVPSNISRDLLNATCTYILVQNPRSAFRNVMKELFADPLPTPVISNNASIDPSVQTDKTMNIGHFTVIEQNCKIGKHVRIGNNTVILKNTVIEDNVTIGSNCTIGGLGFGYEKNEDNEYELVPHIGNVVICKDVEIGNNTCIDRAVMGSTYIGENVKIDNLVHIAHGVEIKKNSLIIANSLIAGSCKIGANVWVAPSATIKNGVNVGDNALIGMGAVIIRDVEKDDVIIGNPGKSMKKK